MVLRLRRFLDVRPGEGSRVLLSFLYIAVVVAAFLLAKPIRNSLFLRQYGPYSLVYVYAAVPLALSLFVPVYTRIASRIGSRAVTIGTLVFFSTNVLLFWYAFHFHPTGAPKPGTTAWLLPGVFYVWVNCFGAIAPVQAWSFANSMFDTRQAKRLFGLVGAGASLGAIAGGLLARFLVGPVGGTVNMMLVLAALILAAAAIVTIAGFVVHRRGLSTRPRPEHHPFLHSLRHIGANRYLGLMAALVFLVAIATQWTAFQLSLVATRRLGSNADALTQFFGTFNFALGAASFMLQLLAAGPFLRRFGVGLTLILLPVLLGVGSVAILLLPAFWPVLLTNAGEQGLRFSLDKASYELLYLPLPSAERGPIKNAIDIVVSRVADAVGAVLLGVSTRGFLMADGLGLGLRGTAALNLLFIGAWLAIVLRLRVEYVRTIERSIHEHRVDAEHSGRATLPATAAAIRAMLMSDDPAEVRDALEIVEARGLQDVQPAVRDLLSHSEPAIRRRALAVLGEAQDRTIDAAARAMLHDPDLGVRTEALLHVTRVMGVDPLRELEALGDVEEFSIRAGMAAFLASPGPSQNLVAARVMLDAMARSEGPSGVRDRTEAAHVLALVPKSFVDLVLLLVQDEDAGVARQAMLAAGGAADEELVTPLVESLARRDLSTDASRALAQYGDALVPELERRLHDASVPLEIRRELPGVLVRIGTPLAQQALIEGLLQTDVTLRHRVLTSLNKLHDLHPEIAVDRQVIELVLAAEIAGHYRSYQLMGPLRAGVGDDEAVLHGLQLAMEQELERIFRLIALLFRGASLHDAYVGVRSSNAGVRANALEFLDNVLDPDLRRLLVPLLDHQVSIDERIAAANRLVGAPFQTAEEAVETLLASPDPWLRNCGVYAVGALQIHSLEGELRRLTGAPDPLQGNAIEVALRRLAGAPDPSQPGVAPHGIEMGVG